MKKIVMIVGSLREKSLNRQLAEQIAHILEEKAEVRFLDYHAIPYMNQDIEDPGNAEIARIRADVRWADGLWIVSPEYNYSYPGVLKNLLDWLSRPLGEEPHPDHSVVHEKRVTISGAGGFRGISGAHAKLTELLPFMRMNLMYSPCTGIAMNREAFQTDVLILSEESIAQLRWQANAFLTFLDPEIV